MRDERFEVTVTFDERRGYVASAPELRHPIVALSLASLRKRIEIAAIARRRSRRAAPRRPRRAGTSSVAGVGAAKQNCAARPTDYPPGPMSALGGSGRAAPKEEVRV